MMFSLAITGPTASGKTALSLYLAEKYSGEIISSDSMQIYRGMDVGTAKATMEEQARVPHHLIDIIEPTESYSVERYRDDAMRLARDVVSRGKTPIFVGGTGLYIDSLLRGGSDKAPSRDPLYTERILAGIKDEGDVLALWERLREVDPESAEKIHRNNVKRVIRALEIYDTVGIPKSTLDKETRRSSPEIFVGMITLDFHDRALLYSRIDERVDIMMREGLLDEARRIYEIEGISDTAYQAIGYKELFSYFKGECSLLNAVEEIKLASRRYAKRQLTWFRREEGAVRIYRDSEDGKLRSEEELISDAVAAYETFYNSFKERQNTNEGR